MSRLHLDFETFSESDIKKEGGWRYSLHPSTLMLCLVWAFDGGGGSLLLPGDPLPAMVVRHVIDGGEVAGHNVGFEYQIWNNVCVRLYGWPPLKPEQLIDTAAKAAYYGLPRDLARCAKALGLSKKDEAGRKVVLKLSRPRRPSKKNPELRWTPVTAPDDFAILYEYCRQDVKVEREIDKALPDLPPSEQGLWLLDLKINERGINVDLPLVDRIIDLHGKYKTALEEECVDLAGAKSSQRDQIMAYAKSCGYPLMGYDKATVAAALEDPRCPAHVADVLNIRAESGKTSISKFKAYKAATCDDGRLRGMFLYHGAGTGRWAGRIVQLHNLARGKLKDIKSAVFFVEQGFIEVLKVLYEYPTIVFGSLIRAVLIPSLGRVLFVTDYSGIEARVVQWLARDADALDVFRSGRDVYIVMAMDIFNKGYAAIDPEGDERYLGKKAILGLGFQMGKDTFKGSCEDDGRSVTDELAAKTVNGYRKKHKKLVQLWDDIEKSAVKCVTTGQDQMVNDLLSFRMRGDWLQMKLPSGRYLSYFKPTIEEKETPWGEVKQALHYWSTDGVAKVYRKTSTYGGKLIENATQGVARDIMCTGMMRIDQAGHDIVGHVHDEIIVDQFRDKFSVAEMEKLMCDLPRWGKHPTDPRLNLVIQAKGKIMERYQK